MHLIFKIVISLFLFLLSIQNVFSQDKPIIAQFNQDGIFYKSLENSSQPLAQFKEDESCIVISYLGNYIYKIKYKEWEGVIKDEYLIINEEMMDLFFAHEKKQRNKVIQDRELRQKKIQQIVNSKKDSIANVKAQEKKQLEAQQRARLEQQRRNENRKQDSIANAKAQEKKRLETLQKARLEQQRIIENRRRDSLANAKTQEKKQLEAQQRARLEQQRRNENRKQDSIANAKAQEKKRLEALQKARLEQQRINENRRRDSIANIKAQKKKQLEALQRARIEQQRINESRKRDSIANAKAQEKKRLEALQKTRLEQQRIIENRRRDSISNVKSQNEYTNLSEKIKSRNTCNYLINEYDNFYKQQIIITDKYTINENLSVELIREGNTSKIHINTREDLGCASYVPSSRSSVTITLQNSQVIKLYHSGSLDCNDFSLKAILSESKIFQLKNSPIKSLTFRGTKRTLTISDIDYKEFFIDKLKCIE